MLDNPIKGYKEHTGEIEVKETEALILGSLIHTLVLEPHEFDNRYIVADDFKMPSEDTLIKVEGREVAMYPKEVLTSTGKLSTAKAKLPIIEELDKDEEIAYLTPNEYASYILYKENMDKKFITQEMLDFANDVATKARDYTFHITADGTTHSFTFSFLEKEGLVQYEKAFYFWIDKDTLEVSPEPKEGFIKAKIKPDMLVKVAPNTYVVYDLKTAQTAGKDEIALNGAKRYWHLQEALYTLGLEAHGLNVFKFRFLIVGKNEWSTAQEYEYDIPTKDLGKEHLSKALKLFDKAQKGELKETVFDPATNEYDLEPTVTAPSWLFYL